MKRTILCILLCAFLAPLSVSAQTLTVTVTNNESYQRQQLVSLNAYDVYKRLDINAGPHFIVKNKLGFQVPYQITYDGKILLDVSVRPCGIAVFTITKGAPATFRSYVFGRKHPERVDDIAWENDKCSYRLYGPALQRTGEDAYGIDVWLKNTPDLVNDFRYASEDKAKQTVAELKSVGKNAEIDSVTAAASYHIDHGYGLDCYKVGPTLGCGVPALMQDGKIVFPYCYKDYEILDNGPLRFTVKLTYNPATVGNDKNVIEQRIISLDKGSNFNKMTITYSGLSKDTRMCAGVVIHTEDTVSVKLGKNFVAYADPTDNPEGQNFQIYVAALFPNGVDNTAKLMYSNPTRGNAGHAVGLCTAKNGVPYTYYFGSAWSKYDCQSFDEWNIRIEKFMASQENPLNVKMQ